MAPIIIEATFTGIVQELWKSHPNETREAIRRVEHFETRREYYATLIRQYETILKNEFVGKTIGMNEETKIAKAITKLHQIEICTLDPKDLNSYICEY